MNNISYFAKYVLIIIFVYPTRKKFELKKLRAIYLK